MEEEYDEVMDMLVPEQVQEWTKESNIVLKELFNITLPEELDSPKAGDSNVDYKSINIPRGALFYPCCGHDISHAISEFASYVESLHFADPFNAPGNNKTQESITTHDVPHVERVAAKTSDPETTVIKEHEVQVHAGDGLQALYKKVPDLSVFYYRGDSPGEGGSNQRWLEPVLFHYVLSRLLDGGLIVTDGSNSGYNYDYFDQYAAWNRFDGKAPFEEPKIGDTFIYADRLFTYIDCIGKHNGPVRVWQVCRVTN